MEFFLCVIGMVMIVEGLPYFAFPNKMKIWVRKIIVSYKIQGNEKEILYSFRNLIVFANIIDSEGVIEKE